MIYAAEHFSKRWQRMPRHVSREIHRFMPRACERDETPPPDDIRPREIAELRDTRLEV